MEAPQLPVPEHGMRSPGHGRKKASDFSHGYIDYDFGFVLYSTDGLADADVHL